MILHPLSQETPEIVGYQLLSANLDPTPAAVVLPDFLPVPLAVQAECRRLSYLNQYPRKLGRRKHLPQFHRYDPDVENILGIFGDIGPHRDGPLNGDQRLTVGLVLVNDGGAKLATGDFTLRGKPTASTHCWPLPVGSLYIMDSSLEHTTLSDHPMSLFSFAAVDFQFEDQVPVQDLRVGVTDLLRRVFCYEMDQITTSWSTEK